MKIQNSGIVSFQITINSDRDDMCPYNYVPEILLIFIVSLFVYL